MTDIIEIKGVKLKSAKSSEIIHEDDLVSVVKLDNIGKGYAIVTKNPNARQALSGITFHTGNPLDGINGISMESLLAICIDRLETFNRPASVSLPVTPGTDDLIPTPLDLSESKDIPISNQSVKAVGGFKCLENDIAIECCKAAIEAIQARQRRRKAEGKLGTQEPETEGIIKLMSEGGAEDAPVGAVYKRSE